MSANSQHKRRQLLAQQVKFLFFIGLCAFAWVIVSSMTSTQSSEEKKTGIGVKVDVSQVSQGQLHKVSLQHKEVWIFHRTEQDIEQLKKQRLPLRSQRNEYFVFFPYEPKRGCLVNWDETSRRFYDTCNARYFDLTGRLVSQTSSQPVLLDVPEYQFVSEQLIQIDAR